MPVVVVPAEIVNDKPPVSPERVIVGDPAEKSPLDGEAVAPLIDHGISCPSFDGVKYADKLSVALPDASGWT
jgi:hypothetical protein